MTRTRATSLTIAVCAMLSLCLLTACETDSTSSHPGNEVDPSSLYSASNDDGTTGTPTVLPVVSDDKAIPAGQTGELVPGVYAALGELNPEQKLILNKAFHLQVKRCMKDQGFTLLDPPPELEVSERSPILFDGYIGILDVDYAQRFGYQADMETFATGADDDNPVGIREGGNESRSTPEYEFALKVANDGGCRGQAMRSIEQDRPSEDESTPVLARIYQESLKATYADPDYKKAISSWSSCMREAGFNYTTPENAFTAFDGFLVTHERPAPTDEEINTALQDVECKRSSRLADVFRRVFWSHQMEMAEQDRPMLEVLDEVNDQLLRNAQKIIRDLG